MFRKFKRKLTFPFIYQPHESQEYSFQKQQEKNFRADIEMLHDVKQSNIDVILKSSVLLSYDIYVMFTLYQIMVISIGATSATERSCAALIFNLTESHIG